MKVVNIRTFVQLRENASRIMFECPFNIDKSLCSDPLSLIPQDMPISQKLSYKRQTHASPNRISDVKTMPAFITSAIFFQGCWFFLLVILFSFSWTEVIKIFLAIIPC